MSDEPAPAPLDFVSVVVRTLVLYSLAEFQAGHASTIRVTSEGASFIIADDGRGHAIDRAIAGAPYLKFIYTHLDYPVEPGRSAPVQLQGIGISVINSLCSELAVTVRKHDATFRLSFRDGRFHRSERVHVKSEQTGNTIAGVVNRHLQSSRDGDQTIQQWLVGVLAVSPGLRLYFNGHEL